MAKATYSTPASDDKFVSQKRTNTKSDLIEITEDKLENILIKNSKYVDLKSKWLTPFSLLFTLVLSLFTTEFKDFISISKYTWQALFIIGIISCSVWLFYVVARIYFYWDKSSIDYLLGQIKNIKDDEEKKD